MQPKMLRLRNSLYLILLSVLIMALPFSVFCQDKQLEREGTSRIEDSEYDLDELSKKVNGHDLKILIDLFEILKVKARVRAGLFFVEEIDEPNAFAFSNALEGNTDGIVVIGTKLLKQLYIRMPRGRGVSQKEYYALLTVVAHELAHLQQIKEKSRLAGKTHELDADYRAGIIIGRMMNVDGPVTDKETFEFFDETYVRAGGELLFAQGDYAFNDPRHHGSPPERLQTFLRGINDGRQSIQIESRIVLTRPQFFEGSVVGAPRSQDREYRDTFDRSTVRSVYFVVYASTDKLPIQQSRRFSFAYKFYNSKAKLLCNDGFEVTIPAGFGGITVEGRCRPEGAWEPGDYVVMVGTDHRDLISHGSFRIK